MLRLPETPPTRHPSRAKPSRDESIADRGDEKLSRMKAAHSRLIDLEVPVSDARMMATILVGLAVRMSAQINAYRDKSIAVTAERMADDISDDMEVIVFAADHLDVMLRGLNDTYMSPLPTGDN